MGQEHVKGGLHPSRAKIGTIFPAIPGKMTVFLVLSLLFHPLLPKIWLPHLNKTYVFEISNNGYSPEKFHTIILKIDNFVAI